MDGGMNHRNGEPKRRIAAQPSLAREIEWLPYYWAPSSIHGWGVFARERIAQGALIGEYKGPETEDNDTYVLWVEDGEELCARNGENGLRFLNHSRSPNACFDGFELYALGEILPGEEITFDYGDESLDFF